MLKVTGHGNNYTNEDIFEQCLTCELVALNSVQNSDFVFGVKCSKGHTPTLHFNTEAKGDTVYVTESYCEYRKKVTENANRNE